MEAHRRASDSRSKRGRSPERHAARHHNGGRPPHRCEPDYRDDRRARHGNTPWHADAGKHRSGGPRRADRRAGDAFSRPCRAGPTALVTLAQINESASAGLEPAKLSLLGPVVIAEWKRRNDDRNLPPKSSGMRVYPVSDTGWISELLRRPWDELGAMVQQSRAQAATTQRQAQLTANGTVVPVAAGAGAGAVAGAVAAGASAATGSSSAPPASLGDNSSTSSVCCNWCHQWKPEDGFSKKGKKERLCLQCSNGARFVCCFCKRDYVDEDGRPDGNFAKDNRETEYGAVCNNCVADLWERRQQDKSEAALAKKRSDDKVAAFEAELTKEKAQRAAAEQAAAQTAAAAQELSSRARQAEQKIESQNRDFEERQRAEREELERKQRRERLEHDAKQVRISDCAQSNLHTNLKSGPRKQARIIAEKEALKEELDGIKQQNVELQVRPTFQISM